MSDSNPGKRKVSSGDGGVAASKRKKTGNEGRWKTPHQQSKPSGVQAPAIEPEDAGIWATCARGMEGRAARELKMLFEDYAEEMYGIKARGDKPDNEGSGDEDVESSIQKELESMKKDDQGSSDQVFTEIRIKEDCLLYFKSKPPVEPVAFVKRICQDAKASGTRKTRYINRLTPITLVGKATVAGVDEVSRRVLSGCFSMASTATSAGKDLPAASGSTEDRPAYTYAIRLSIRNHSTLKRDDVIKQIASLVDPRHKVNLGAPDKVVLVDIYQTVCGVSVVDGDWADLKKYNLTELYSQAAKTKVEQEQPKSSTNGTVANDS